MTTTPPRRPTAFPPPTFFDTCLLPLLAHPPHPEPLPLARGWAVQVRGALSPSEASALVSASEDLRFVPASLNVRGEQLMDARRRSGRLQVDSPSFASALWERVRHAVPATLQGRTALGLNERLRVLRYQPGDSFAPHADGHWARADGTSSSLLTLLLYLNGAEDYEGGRTIFYESEDEAHAAWRAEPGAPGAPGFAVVPEEGLVLLQDQEIWHAVPMLEAGVKYVLRTEVLYAAAAGGV